MRLTIFDWFLITIASVGLLLNVFVVPHPEKELNESHPHNASYEARGAGS